ncbi:hypothetical protein [Paenibacillus ferrarius]|uniref:hypothetical protein n=1 Tax=Paenibacillus ferrarius TaxID=1469647 RepID=UPI003D2A89B2
MSCPEYIKSILDEHSDYEWIEKDDCLDLTGSPYDQKNQIDWWKQNVKIRAAFKRIEHELKKMYKAENKISVRLVSWTRIAKLAACDRNTLRHPKRYHWTNKHRERLLHRITELSDNCLEYEREESKLTSIEAQTLQLQLEKSRNEVARWVYQFKDMEHELKKYKRLANMRGKTIERLTKLLTEMSVKNSKGDNSAESNRGNKLIHFPSEEDKST